jgi:hypothetical protein
MSTVDGRVLVVCSGANVRVVPWADWTDETARRSLRGRLARSTQLFVDDRQIGVRVSLSANAAWREA